MRQETLVELLRAKEAAQAVYDAACKECRKACEDSVSLSDRVKLDIIKQRAVRDSAHADNVYADALRSAICTDAELAASESRP